MTLVDTSSWIEYLRGRSSAPGHRVEALVPSGEAVWCDVTLAELWHGANGAREKRGLAEMETVIKRVAVDGPVWNRTFRLARLCREKGLTVPVSDLIIAACAAQNALDLEHCDQHFDKVLPLARSL